MLAQTVPSMGSSNREGLITVVDSRVRRTFSVSEEADRRHLSCLMSPYYLHFCHSFLPSKLRSATSAPLAVISVELEVSVCVILWFRDGCYWRRWSTSPWLDLSEVIRTGRRVPHYWTYLPAYTRSALFSCLVGIYTVSQKNGHTILCLLTLECWPMLIILSLSHSQMECR